MQVTRTIIVRTSINDDYTEKKLVRELTKNMKTRMRRIYFTLSRLYHDGLILRNPFRNSDLTVSTKNYSNDCASSRIFW